MLESLECQDPRDTEVSPDVVVPTVHVADKEKREVLEPLAQLVPQDLRALVDHPVTEDVTDPQVLLEFVVKMVLLVVLAPPVLLAPQEMLDSPDLQDKREMLVPTESLVTLALPAQLAPTVFQVPQGPMVPLEREELTVVPDPKETEDRQDPPVSQDSPEPKAHPEPPVKLVLQEHLESLVVMVNLEPQGTPDQEVTPDHQESAGLLVCQDLKERGAHQDPQDLPAPEAQQESQVHLELPEVKVARDSPELQEQMD